MADPKAIAAKLRQLSQGREEWRVQHPVDKSYCFSANRYESLNPEREVREWLEDHRRRFPDSMHAEYEVAKHFVLTELQRAALEAADLLDPPSEAPHA